MLYAGLDLSRKRLDFHLLDGEGKTVDVGGAPPDAEGLRALTERLDRHHASIRAAIESMNGARFVHDRLELAGWQVENYGDGTSATNPGCCPSHRYTADGDYTVKLSVPTSDGHTGCVLSGALARGHH